MNYTSIDPTLANHFESDARDALQDQNWIYRFAQLYFCLLFQKNTRFISLFLMDISVIPFLVSNHAIKMCLFPMFFQHKYNLETQAMNDFYHLLSTKVQYFSCA